MKRDSQNGARAPGIAEVESFLTRFLSDLLSIPTEAIGPDDNFFSLGADSLLIEQLAERVNSMFFADRPDEEPGIAEFFTHGTVRSLAARLAPNFAERVVERPEVAGDLQSIAVIGLACRFPGAADIDTFWSNLCNGVESITSFEDDEILRSGVSAAELRHPRYVKRGAVIEGVHLFDAAYFGLTPREAAISSPEQRLLVECSEEALQDAGRGDRRGAEQVGVFVGTGLSSYLLQQLPAFDQFESSAGMGLLAANTCAAARISYLLDLTGPSITLDTACSSSLVAIHLACQAILRDECPMALAGGATVRRFGHRGYRAEDGGIFSPDGHCRPFDRRAQGTVGSSGAAMVLLKRLSQAIADRDTIYAVIRGTAVNNDGGAKAGYSAPSAAGQAGAIRAALLAARLESSDIQYVETHGTATPVGDAIEIAALREVFSSAPPGGGHRLLGTLKANLGHLEAAAGVAGLIKTVLALKHRQIPPAIHFREAFEGLALERSAFGLNGRLAGWPQTQGPRRAGVSSFGIGGTNAHAILEEPPIPAASVGTRDVQILPISARSDAALQESCVRLVRRLHGDPQGNLADIAHTLQVGRKPFPYRRYVLASSTAETVRGLQAPDSFGSGESCAVRNSPIAFLFPGQGCQYPGMLRGLYGTEPQFRAQLDECARLLVPVLGRSLLEIVNDASGELAQTAWCQPALFAIEYSLARLWQSWGITPSVMIGHSLGEYVAACISGLLSLTDALTLVSIRGSLMQRTPPGRMLAVRMNAGKAARLLSADCALAAVNGQESCVLSGGSSTIAQIQSTLHEMGVPSVELGTQQAFHSPLMDGVLNEFGRALRAVKWGEVQIPFVSNRTGQLVERELVARPEYWLDHLRYTVDFRGGLETLLQGPARLFLEVGPGNVLGKLVRSRLGSAPGSIVASARRAEDEVEDSRVLMDAVGRLWQCGAPIDWRAFNEFNSLRRVSLPAYPFERGSHWIEPKAIERGVARVGGQSRPAMPDWFQVAVWKQSPRLKAPQPPQPLNASTAHCCLVFGDRPDLEEGLRTRLVASGMRVICVSMGDRFSQGDGRYSLDSRGTSPWAQLLDALEANGLTVSWIVHCGEAGHDASQTEAPDENRLSRGLYSILELCKTIAGREHGEITLTLITEGAHAIADERATNPCGAMLATVTRVISTEIPSLSCRTIDLAPPRADIPEFEAASLDMLVEEIQAHVRENVVAFRGTTRWVRVFERLPPPDASASVSQLLRERGVYLITGGMGGIGWTLASHLAKRVSARVILVGRSEFPDRSVWQGLLATQGAQGAVCSRIREILALERNGAEVLTVSGDVSSRADMERVIALAHRRYGRLDGVIHSAGVAGGSAIATSTRAMVARVLSPKVMGTWVLHEACKSMQPDFFVCCSSIAVMIAPAGWSSYCAANAFQDAFCLALDRRSRTRFISINWEAWRDVGMALSGSIVPHKREQRERELAAALSSDEGAQVFDIILSNPLPQWIISTRELHGDESQRPSERAGSLDDARPPTADSLSPIPSDSDRNAVGSLSASPQSAIEGSLAIIWRELLGVDAWTAEDDFFSLGGDSLLAVQLRSRLESQFRRSLSLKALLSSPTVAGMARLLRETT